MDTTSHYRKDIDGLRALAVVLVVLYHLGVPGFGGGFVGVDVFFVISGFVVTRMLLRDMRTEAFSFRRFYVNRFWRLQPAFLLMAVTTLGVSAWLLGPADLFRTAQSAVWATLPAANFYFWWSGGEYGSPLTDQEPFLHAWSLAVEEQFYLLWPLVLRFCSRRASASRPAFLLALLAVLIALSEYLAQSSPSLAYYLLPTRLMELGLGALLVRLEPVVLSPRIALSAQLCGLLLILGATAFLSETSVFPGLRALPPCVGAGLLIWGGGTPTRFGAVQGSRVPELLGRVSYSFYLWHWPPIALAHYLDVELTPAVQLLIGFGALALACATFYLLESKTRRAPSKLYRVLVFTLLGVLVVGVAYILRPGSDVRTENDSVGAFTEKISNDRVRCVLQAENWEALDNCKPAVTAVSGRKRVLIWGDSHASAVGASVKRAAEQLGYTPTTLSVSGCPPAFDVHRSENGKPSKRCNETLGKSVQKLLKRYHFDAIILVGRFNIYKDGWKTTSRSKTVQHYLANERTQSKKPSESLRALLRGLKATARTLARDPQTRIVLMLDTPELPKEPKAKRKGKGVGLTRQAYLKQRAWLDRFARELPSQVRVLDPIDALCDAEWCSAWDEQDRLMYRDSNHLSQVGADRLAPLLDQALNQ